MTMCDVSIRIIIDLPKRPFQLMVGSNIGAEINLLQIDGRAHRILVDQI